MESDVKGDARAAISYYEKAIDAYPDFTQGNTSLTNMQRRLGRYENALSGTLKIKGLLDRSNVPNIDPRQLSVRRALNDGYIAFDKGDYREALRNFKIGADAPAYFGFLNRDLFTGLPLMALAGQHDGRGARSYLFDLGISSIQKRLGSNIAYLVAGGLEDWPTIRQLGKATSEDELQKTYRSYPFALAITAVAHARMGDLKSAETLIAQSPTDSDDCVIARGWIADMQHQYGRADYWFDRVEKQQPSIPMADAEWGKALLKRGKPDDAIAKFTLANKKGPHFADPLEGWGEALMAKNQSHLALAKFAEANKYAPNWGRLHLKWGEALNYVGKRDEAKAQFARAAGLNLTPSERAELKGRGFV
jgi:tetratricopeptide (TPR) repeat protein